MDRNFICIFLFNFFFCFRQQVHVKNPYLHTLEEDILYHFSLSTKSHNLPEMFGDIKVLHSWENQ